jgi:hypothetical protein
LGPVTALRDLLTVAEASERGQGLTNSQDRKSLAEDCLQALGSVGTSVKDHLGPRLGDYRMTTLRQLDSLLAGPAGARRASQATLAMLSALREQGAARAAWDDCVNTFGQGSAELAVCRLRLTQLQEVLQARGHDWPDRASRLAELVAEGDLTYARELVALPPTRNVKAVWMVFDNANLGRERMQCGPVLFIDQSGWPDAARAENPQTGLPYAPELTEETLALLKAPSANDHFVWCRVTVDGPGAVSPGDDVPQRPAHEMARQLASSLVEAATFAMGGSAWKLQLGCMSVHHSGSTTLTERFRDAAYTRALESFRPPVHDPTANALDEVTGEFAEAVAAGRPDAQDAIREVRWYESAEAAPDPAQRLALHIRALEHALPIMGSESWTDPARRYLREHWVDDQVHRVVWRLGAAAADILRHTDPQALEDYAQFVVYDEDDPAAFLLTYGAVVRHAKEIAGRLPAQEWALRRGLRELSRRTATSGDALKWLELLGKEFDTYLIRSARERNATVHGVPTYRPAVDSVVDFVAQLSAYVVAQTVHRVAAQRDPLAEFELARGEALMTRHRLQQGNEPVDRIIFAPREGP